MLKSVNNEEFTFSIKAQNVEAKFYNKKAIVYVEGVDDINFWKPYFPSSDFEIKSVNGCNNLKKKLDEIKSSGLRCILACDSDYGRFKGDMNQHPLIIYTHSHSIECMMYCPYNINECVKKLSKTTVDTTEDIQLRYKQFGLDIKELVAYDIANNINEIGVEVLGNSCVRFLKSNSSINIDATKVSSYIEGLKPHFASVDIDHIRQLMDTDGRTMRQITKGHFQTSFIINLIKSLVNKTSGTQVSLSDVTLYALLVNCSHFCSQECDEVSMIRAGIDRALEFLNLH